MSENEPAVIIDKKKLKQSGKFIFKANQSSLRFISNTNRISIFMLDEVFDVLILL